MDVRTQEEWDEGHLKGAKLVTPSKEGFAAKAKAVLDPKKPVVVYCHSGRRSAMAVKPLRAGGFTAVFEIAGGLTAWEKKAKPVVK
jgi:rhodanese-related sulfurtransferase